MALALRRATLLLMPPWLPAGAQMQGQAQAPAQARQDGPFDVVARQLVEEECREVTDSTDVAAWCLVQARVLEAQALLFAGAGPVGAAGSLEALALLLQVLAALLGDLRIAFQCPVAGARHFLLGAQWAATLGQRQRARVLAQLGNQFKLQAMARWWTRSGAPAPGTHFAAGAPAETQPAPMRWEIRLQTEYTLAVSQLHGSMQANVRPIRRHPESRKRPRIEVHSICTYKPDPTSNTGLDSPLPKLSVPNHRAYSERHGYRYVLHTELPLPDREAHYSKMLVVHEALRREDGPDWVLFIDCDAFFTNADVSVEDLLATYATPQSPAAGGGVPFGAAGGPAGAQAPNFLVAEDPGGINTGVFLFRACAWSLAFLERVANSAFSIAWDQSMFLLEMVRDRAFFVDADGADFQLPSEVMLMPQAHLNAFVPPASRDWMAYEWQPGDFIRHFAGCPWQEAPCLSMMRETAAHAQQQLRAASAGTAGVYSQRPLGLQPGLGLQGA
eukprot:TRINITY_DN17968_c0_g1_i1.p1 TRINITY_DN17968_c0_g1~~TRINITY_DN17968_c0_g1_i1.p1  ORF type:complete len:538 (+),score=120.33 TRINITY_DN17968_c0_g1_i1:113-1615(+)